MEIDLSSSEYRHSEAIWPLGVATDYVLLNNGKNRQGYWARFSAESDEIFGARWGTAKGGEGDRLHVRNLLIDKQLHRSDYPRGPLGRVPRRRRPRRRGGPGLVVRW